MAWTSQARWRQRARCVASSLNAFDDIVAELSRRRYREIILETLPAHVSHWLHVDLSQRLAHLGYPLTTVTATHQAASVSARPVQAHVRKLGS